MADRVKWLLIAAIFAVASALGFALYQAREKEKAEEMAGLDAARAVSEVLQSMNSIEVQNIAGEIVVKSGAECGYGMFHPGQTTRLKYNTVYTVPLGELNRGSYRWNEQSRIMSVDVPEIVVGKPAVDMANAVIKQKGAYICRDAGIKMQRDAAVRGAAKATERANAPENINSARENARKVIASLVSAPLAAAGLSNVQVAVRFPGDPRPAGLSKDQWDLSRSVEEIYEQYGNAR